MASASQEEELQAMHRKIAAVKALVGEADQFFLNGRFLESAEKLSVSHGLLMTLAAKQQADLRWAACFIGEVKLRQKTLQSLLPREVQQTLEDALRARALEKEEQESVIFMSGEERKRAAREKREKLHDDCTRIRHYLDNALETRTSLRDKISHEDQLTTVVNEVNRPKKVAALKRSAWDEDISQSSSNIRGPLPILGEEGSRGDERADDLIAGSDARQECGIDPSEVEQQAPDKYFASLKAKPCMQSYRSPQDLTTKEISLLINLASASRHAQRRDSYTAPWCDELFMETDASVRITRSFLFIRHLAHASTILLITRLHISHIS